MNIRQLLDDRITAALHALGAPANVTAIVKPSARPEFGDYQANGVMAAAKQLKLNPRELATRLLETLERTPDGTTTALVFFDVDHFKELNDQHGHPAGDEVLRRIVQALLSCTPADALLARYGGEEFACLLPGSDAVQATATSKKCAAS